MLEILQYATSGFWTFIGCFLLFGLVVRGGVAVLSVTFAAASGRKDHA